MGKKLIRKFDRRTLWALLGVFVAVTLFSFLIQTIKGSVDAANLNKFDAGYIISDYQMRNYNSMSEAEIQSFLESKVSCNKGWSYYKYLTSNYSGYDWHYKDGHIVCLPEERFGDGQTIGSGDTAAHIIWQAAHDYKINPQVLIVLLQKEQGLITDSYPNDVQYRSATGYGCPDTAPCSSEYYGFKNQVRKAAALFNTVLSGGWTNYPLGYNYIQYNPNSDCGGSWVNVRNLATSALYRYTPYQPNDGALAAGYGSAYCGAYGNRNFYAYFEDWFGGITEEVKKITEIEEYNLKPGIYNILSAGDKSKAISVANESSDSGSNVKTGVYRDAKIQQWKVTKTKDYYTITNVQTGKVLDVQNGDMLNRTNIWQYTGNDTCAQRWKFAKNSNGSLIIHNACDLTYVIDLQDGNTNIQTYMKTSYYNNNQNWFFEGVIKKDANIEPGIYSILSAGDKTKTISVANESSDKGANVKTGIYRGAKIQRWKIAKVKDYYVVTNVQTGKVLDIRSGTMSNHTNIWQYTENDSCAQQWEIEDNSDGTITFRSTCGRRYVLDLQDGNTNIQLYQKTSYDNNNQKWVLKKQEIVDEDDDEDEKDANIEPGIYSILSAGDKTKTISVANESSDDGANIKTGIYRGARIQQWKVTKTKDYYTITNVQTGKVLDIQNASMNNHTNIWQYTGNDTCAQRWVFGKNSDDSVTVYNACDKRYVLDLQDGNTNIQLYQKTSYDNNNQKWVLKGQN